MGRKGRYGAVCFVTFKVTVVFSRQAASMRAVLHDKQLLRSTELTPSIRHIGKLGFYVEVSCLELLCFGVQLAER